MMQARLITLPLLFRPYASSLRSSVFRPTIRRTKTSSSSSSKRVEIDELSSKHGVRLTQTEQRMLRQQLDSNGDGIITRRELQKAGRKALESQWERELCLQVIEQPVSYTSRMAATFLSVLDYSGTALFAIVGTQLAGEAGMNLVGCTLVGCITCLGGGTLNNLLYGSSASLLGRPGVFWVTTPSYLVTAVAASMATFFLWPVYCRNQARNEMEEFIGKDNLEEDGSISLQTFVKACQRNPEFTQKVASAFGVDPTAISASELFQLVDTDKSNHIELDEMQALVGKRFDASPTIYALDTLALAAFAVVGVNGAIGRGLPPLVAATSGVTMCFGGIMRDVMCGREVAIGGQSYAFTTGAGSLMYVLLRELRLRQRVIPIPLIARMVIAFSTTVSLRVFEFWQGAPLLQSMHHEIN
ncbi:Membrane [Seminavis robusta]|uniref:Membrane n=1 Tax=Seminavis robusta TaxID=568900 RepID=A0A9N8DEG4_9STRA|nr:Membrane [Seminavis robusta]|eukprot:Sro56_g033010.1 Membrane (414) ;mRNA; r:127252-128493